MKEIFNPLTEEERRDLFAEILDSGYRNVAITLTTGQILYGDISIDIITQYKEYTKSFQEISGWSDFNGKPISNSIEIGFPDGSGTIFGHSHSVTIPVDMIADVQGLVPYVRIDESEKLMRGAEEYLHNAPNPLAKSVCEHNNKIILDIGLKYGSHIECGLDREAVPPEGIYFDGFTLIYSDWKYFHTISGGINNIGAAFLGSIGWDKSLKKLMMKKLKKNDYINHLLDSQPEYNTEIKLYGYIYRDSRGQDTMIDGEKCNLYGLKIEDHPVHSKFQTIPILAKVNSFVYPEDFLLSIKSVLTIYGELIEIPIKLNEISFPSALLARAIAYIPDE